ncbi:HisA/HisF-related TIM barrel protein [Aporhodopirellula aestuarii]|uniref:HisA/HisF-related TIM barrel protein n=1 Tax=Aporhodopirellula aestuarii TaxID=2950107 RepID=A0ABT0TYU4_9BACT|nr:HisA/HisF-related TIM barrel protein [Aporhodopirellula aestuarii]MCM2369741.1 HisA/HisF-related TIM barrel protein [Aporhodopirellula aestuarii]
MSERPDVATFPSQWKPHAANLIGVVDLKAGVAVHAIAGNREHYRAVSPLWRNALPANGNPLALVDWYRRYSIRRFYLADIDALTGGEIQREVIAALLANCLPGERWMIDVGLNANGIDKTLRWMSSCATSPRAVDWIIASESAESTRMIERVSETLDPETLILGVDFRDGRFIGPNSDLDQWLRIASQSGLRRAVVLDVATVGTDRGPAAAGLCRTLSQRYRGWQWISGGGCRSPQDVAAFLNAGCDGCLMASALLPSAASG